MNPLGGIENRWKRYWSLSVNGGEERTVKTKNIQQSVIIKAAPREVYEALMDSRKHSKFTGAKASISRKVGGRCSVYGNYIRGINLDLIPNKRIVQAWRGSDWPKGHYSIATFFIE
jgi:uncharacterized protein YndB with AHSA1/START domain